MIPPLKQISAIYEYMEQGNIGKLLIAIDDAVMVYTAQCMGGNRRGREGILQLVPAFYRPGTGMKKTVERLIAQDNLVIAVGTIQITGQDAIIILMPFADVWSYDNNKICEVIFYYRNPQELHEYLLS